MFGFSCLKKLVEITEPEEFELTEEGAWSRR